MRWWCGWSERRAPRCAPSRLRKFDRADGFRECRKIARRRLALFRRRGRRRAARPLSRSLHTLEHEARNKEQERRLPNAAMPVDHLLRSAYHPERIGLSGARRVEDEGLVPRRAGQGMGAEAGHEAERVSDAFLLQIADRRLIDRVAGIAEGKHQSDRLIVVGLRADEDWKLFRRAGSEGGAGHEIVDRE